MLQLHGGRQHIVGMVRGVGAEVLQHHGEQVLAGESCGHPGRVGRDRHRVAVVDHQRLDARPAAQFRRSRLGQQRVADVGHVDAARAAAGQQVRALQLGVAQRLVPARGRQQQPPGAVSPGAHQAGQQCNQPHRIAATAHPLHAVVQADRRWRGAAIVARQTLNFVDGEATDRRRPLRRPLQCPFAQLWPALHPALQVVRVQPVVHDQLVHQAQRQRTVAAGAQGQVLVALLGGFAAPRVDGDQLRAASFGLLRKGPEVHAGGDRVAAPDQDQPALGKVLQVHAHGGSVGQLQPGGPRLRTNAAMQTGRPQPVPEAPGHRLTLHETHRAGIAVGSDGLGVACGDGPQPRSDVVQCLIPAHRRELTPPLRPDALERRQHPVWVFDALHVPRHLGAQGAVGGRVVRVALQLHHAPALHRHPDGTGVRAIVRTGGVHQRSAGQGVAGGGKVGRGSHAEMMAWAPAAGKQARR